jgi:RNA polymerase sigma factor (sigma-70 family)
MSSQHRQAHPPLGHALAPTATARASLPIGAGPASSATAALGSGAVGPSRDRPVGASCVDGTAQEAFCRAQHPRLVAALTAYTGDRDLAVELSQEVLARACLHWQTVADLAAPGAWTHRVAMNLANSTFRRRRYERAALARAGSRAASCTPEPLPPLDRVVRAALASLPARQREAVVLRYVLDLSVEATALHMHCAAGTVRALSAQGISRLRQHPELADLKEPHDD